MLVTSFCARRALLAGLHIYIISMHPIQYHACLFTHHNVVFKSVLAFLLILLPFFFLSKKNQKYCKFITLSKRFQAFALVDQRYFSIDFATLLKLPFCIENQYKFFYWKSIDFCPQHFSIENLYKKFPLNLQYILNLRFCFENQYKCFH